MTEPNQADAVASASSAPTKAATVLKLLCRRTGATLTEITAATGWQPHSARAHLTRLRQAGSVLDRVERKTGPAAYKLGKEAATAFAESVSDAKPAARAEPQA